MSPPPSPSVRTYLMDAPLLTSITWISMLKHNKFLPRSGTHFQTLYGVRRANRLNVRTVEVVLKDALTTNLQATLLQSTKKMMQFVQFHNADDLDKVGLTPPRFGSDGDQCRACHLVSWSASTDYRGRPGFEIIVPLISYHHLFQILAPWSALFRLPLYNQWTLSEWLSARHQHAVPFSFKPFYLIATFCATRYVSMNADPKKNRGNISGFMNAFSCPSIVYCLRLDIVITLRHNNRTKGKAKRNRRGPLIFKEDQSFFSYRDLCAGFSPG